MRITRCSGTGQALDTPLKSAFNGLQFRRCHCRSIFIRLAVVASQSREITRNSDKIWPYSSSRSSKVIDLGANRKPMYDFLFWPYLLPFSRYWRLKLENRWIFLPHTCLRPRGNPLEFGDEIWRQKTRIMGLRDGEEIMTLAFFVLTQYRLVTDRRTDTLPWLLPAVA